MECRNINGDDVLSGFIVAAWRVLIGVRQEP
jgi:hypothetical protein